MTQHAHPEYRLYSTRNLLTFLKSSRSAYAAKATLSELRKPEIGGIVPVCERENGSKMFLRALTEQVSCIWPQKPRNITLWIPRWFPCFSNFLGAYFPIVLGKEFIEHFGMGTC